MLDHVIIIPSKRPIEHIQKCLNYIYQTLNLQKYSYQIYIYSSEEIKGDHIKWIKDYGDSAVFGVNYIYHLIKNKTYSISTFGDSVGVSPQFFDSVEYILEKFPSNRKIKIASLPDSPQGTPCRLPCGEAKDFTHMQKMDGCVSRFPILETDSVETYLNGYLFNPFFKHHWVDNWLGYYLTKLGEPSFEIPLGQLAISTIPHQQFTNHDEHDKKIILKLMEQFNTNKHTTYIECPY